jgi:hypothetical protein
MHEPGDIARCHPESGRNPGPQLIGDHAMLPSTSKVTPRATSHEELEFTAAMQEYKRRSGRMFPTWSEVLEVLQDLGYQKPESYQSA